MEVKLIPPPKQQGLIQVTMTPEEARVIIVTLSEIDRSIMLTDMENKLRMAWYEATKD